MLSLHEWKFWFFQHPESLQVDPMTDHAWMTSTDRFVQRFEIEKSNRQLHVQHFDHTLSSLNCFLEILALPRLWFRNKGYSNNPISFHFCRFTIRHTRKLFKDINKYHFHTLLRRNLYAHIYKCVGSIPLDICLHAYMDDHDIELASVGKISGLNLKMKQFDLEQVKLIPYYLKLNQMSKYFP